MGHLFRVDRWRLCVYSKGFAGYMGEVCEEYLEPLHFLEQLQQYAICSAVRTQHEKGKIRPKNRVYIHFSNEIQILTQKCFRAYIQTCSFNPLGLLKDTIQPVH